MRKTLLLSSLLLSITLHCSSQDVDQTLQGLYKFSDEYFRSDPFKGDFSGFLKHLINDPGITEKAIQKKTDTSFYTFFGVYKTYNPFFLKPKRLEILLEEKSIGYSDSVKAEDTVFLYQLIAYIDDNEKGREELMKEFDKIHRQTKRKFFDSSYKDVVKNDKVVTAWHNYFVPFYSLAPLSVIWTELKEEKELVLNITLRFKMSANQAVLPMPLYRAK